MESVSDLLELLKRNSGTWRGLLVGFLLPPVVLQLVPEDAWVAQVYWCTLLGLEVVVALAWLYFRRGGLHASKIRLVLAIYCDKEDQRAELEEDFSKSLRQILREGQLGKDVGLITASKAECERIDCDADFSALADRKKAHLLLYGRIRTRRENDADVHMVELRAIVRHAKLAEHAKLAFQQEISSVFPSQMIRIPKNDQLPHFRITADWIGFSSRYLISLAALTSGDLDYSQKILKDAELLLPRLPANLKQRSALGERVSFRQHEVAVLQARRSYAAWRSSRDPIEVEKVRERLVFAEGKAKLRPENTHLLASAIFISSLDAAEAEKMVRAAMFDHAVAHLNSAFLCAWQGKFDAARRSYRAAARKKPDADITEQVLTFFEWLSVKDPSRAYICNWCEAHFLLATRSDVEKALRILAFLVRMVDVFPGDEISRMKQERELHAAR